MLKRFLRHGGVIVVLLLAAFAYWKLHSHPPKAISVGYIADRNVMLWNTLAQVRQPIAELHYGERVEVLRDEGTSLQVRTASSIVGWIQDSREIMDSLLWDRSASLLQHARTLPVQAHGRTKAASNVRIEPGRNGKRVFQLMRGTPVVVLQRTVADAPRAAEENTQDDKNVTSQNNKREDWLLVMVVDGPSKSGMQAAPAETAEKFINPASNGAVGSGPQSVPGADTSSATATPIAGWVLARFIEYDLPGPVRDYASSADLHVVAWFELNRVPDGSGSDVPQYLVAGARGGEGQPCDFTMLRVYTWGAVRKRYETAYIESDLCGKLPIHVSNDSKGPEFRFTEAGEGNAVRTYVMRQTEVRRVKDPTDRPSHLHH